MVFSVHVSAQNFILKIQSAQNNLLLEGLNHWNAQINSGLRSTVGAFPVVEFFSAKADKI